MLHYDYTLDIEYGRYIMLDAELTLEKIRFQEGSYLQVCKTPSGQVILKTVDPILAFAEGLPNRSQEGEQ